MARLTRGAPWSEAGDEAPRPPPRPRRWTPVHVLVAVTAAGAAAASCLVFGSGAGSPSAAASSHLVPERVLELAPAALALVVPARPAPRPIALATSPSPVAAAAHDQAANATQPGTSSDGTQSEPFVSPCAAGKPLSPLDRALDRMLRRDFGDVLEATAAPEEREELEAILVRVLGRVARAMPDQALAPTPPAADDAEQAARDAAAAEITVSRLRARVGGGALAQLIRTMPRINEELRLAPRAVTRMATACGPQGCTQFRDELMQVQGWVNGRIETVESVAEDDPRYPDLKRRGEDATAEWEHAVEAIVGPPLAGPSDGAPRTRR